jgi:hypothetical protein
VVSDRWQLARKPWSFRVCWGREKGPYPTYIVGQQARWGVYYASPLRILPSAKKIPGNLFRRSIPTKPPCLSICAAG